uniref:Uncharacterized protein n=1 Tax=Rhizophora mucronata TaxID=61149 RepID=A0A2P2Q0N6_RHIMU
MKVIKVRIFHMACFTCPNNAPM